MKKKLMQVLCEEDGFMIQSNNKEELIKMLKMHVKKIHGMNITNKEAEEKICIC